MSYYYLEPASTLPDNMWSCDYCLHLTNSSEGDRFCGDDSIDDVIIHSEHNYEAVSRRLGCLKTIVAS